MADDFSPMQLGRILERLDQQDRNTLNAALALQKEAAVLANETKANSARLADEIMRNSATITAALESHIAEDAARFNNINKKLDELLELKAQVKGGKAVIISIVLAVGTIVGWFLSYIGR